MITNQSTKSTMYRGFKLSYHSIHSTVLIKLDGNVVGKAKDLEAAKVWVSKDLRAY